jgi:hypothetical protein
MDKIYRYAISNASGKIVFVDERFYDLWRERWGYVLCMPEYEDVNREINEGRLDEIHFGDYQVHRFLDTHKDPPNRCDECFCELRAGNKTGFCSKHRYLNPTVKIQRREYQRVYVGTRNFRKKAEDV